MGIPAAETPKTSERERTAARSALPLGAISSLTVAAGLARHALDMLDTLSPASSVDTLVALGVTAGGAILAAWLGLHLLLATLCLLGAACGRRWRTGERLVSQHGPAVVRRGLAAALGASLGLGGLAAASADAGAARHVDDVVAVTAAEAPSLHPEVTSRLHELGTGPDVRASASPSAGTDDPLDLGWRPTPDLELVADADDDPESEESVSPEGDQRSPEAPSRDARDGAPDDGSRETAPQPDDGTSDERPDVRPDHASGEGSPDDAAHDDASTDDSRDPAALDESADELVEDGTGSDTAPDGTTPDTKRTAPAVESYVVSPGDTLWSITDRLLGGATDSRVAAAWPELYEANRDVVGGEPDLIHPGQELVVPAALKELT